MLASYLVQEKPLWWNRELWMPPKPNPKSSGLSHTKYHEIMALERPIVRNNTTHLSVQRMSKSESGSYSTMKQVQQCWFAQSLSPNASHDRYGIGNLRQCSQSFVDWNQTGVVHRRLEKLKAKRLLNYVIIFLFRMEKNLHRLTKQRIVWILQIKIRFDFHFINCGILIKGKIRDIQIDIDSQDCTAALQSGCRNL